MPQPATNERRTLSVNNISKRYDAVVALRDVNFSLEPGEIRALYGGNGSGKSTAAKVVGGAVRPDHGTVAIDGVPLEPGSPRVAQAKGIAITFQELSLLPELTVAENLAFADMPRWKKVFRSEARIYRQAKDMLAQLGLAHLAALPVNALQVGEKYLVEFAKALLRKPRYVVLDEVTSALHASEAEIVRRILREHQARGGATLFVSHRVQEILEFCDSITVLRNGEVAADDRIANVNAQMLVRWAGGSNEVAAKSRPSASAPAAVSAPARLAVSGLRVGDGAQPIELSVRPGEIYGLGGLPDQGQQAVLATVFGFRRDSTARIRLDGRPVRFRTPKDAVLAGLAYIAGDRDEVGFGPVSISENIQAVLLNRTNARQPAGEELHSILKRLSTVYAGLALPLNSLSGGNQQKVLLARCFIVRPKLLVASDPTKGIDVAARAEVHQSIRELARELGAGVLITSSEDSELADLCDRVAVMERNQIKCELSREGGNLTSRGLIEAYLQQG